jgi:biopolymer transport protein ExbD
MADYRRGRSRARRVALTPLVDVVFILLIFFMLETRFVTRSAMELGLDGGVAQAGHPLRVELHADGATWVAGTRVVHGGLTDALAAADGTAGAVVATDPGVPLQRTVDVIDALRARGIDAVALQRAETFR